MDSWRRGGGVWGIARVVAPLTACSLVLAGCSLQRRPGPAEQGSELDDRGASCGAGASCVPSADCACAGGSGGGPGNDSTGSGGVDVGSGGVGEGAGSGGTPGSGGSGMPGSGGTDLGTGGSGGAGGTPNYPTANPLNISPGATEGSCPAGLRCSNSMILGTVCTEADGSSRVCATNPDCQNYGPDAICQFTPTFQAYCFQPCNA